VGDFQAGGPRPGPAGHGARDGERGGGQLVEADFAGAVQQLGHAGIGGCFPRGASDVAGEFLRPGIGLDEQPGFLRARIVDDDAGPQQLVMFGNFDVQRLRDRLSFEQHSVIEVERAGENELDPMVMRGGIGLPLLA
jgi:hypothetical protein